MTGVRNGVLTRIITSVSGNTTLGTVPAGLTWLVKTIHVQNSSSATARVVLELSDAAAAHVAFVFDEQVESGKSFSWYGWTACGPSDRVVGYSDQAPIQWWIAGAELPGAIP